ncbi:4-hydroxyphenylpyruvate dioxygenase-like protein [Sceloporus undulatus]|uniref:4-hydroxyphenylpyruvate dioxygenase-like protein n=1 Tax=Sceloporus undulatus TaxID=8520 RepID=UPI001C4CF4A0|nr:4-hydroxyphenylpyruvate dioxygenase-like protein [Sceloporus undulatus]XP_042317407.1 4-hydroxyphenylpyruvate dioxygenase-like protein [Sceloporus undulatus]XP_042317408.1 4-hydroxyphenylpyruvate dioxygenase-like protein [Sceloporus undulatus]XP_042317409.1 4-hydroxyphenylpyruvate dioxygenase-like protein [Sceloporus undulatus]
MALLNRLCYIGLHVLEKQQLANDLVSKFGFELFATRETEWSRQLALRRGDAIFVVNEKREQVPGEFPSEPSPEQSRDSGILYDVDLQYAVSTVSNICFETEDVSGISLSLQKHGCQILIPPTTIADEDGCVIYSVVKSIVGNISHTLLDRSQYCGPFLPGFQVEKDALKKFQQPGEITHFDHITYVCPQGSTQAVLDWYKNCFDFQRFLVHKQDDAIEGYVIQGAGVGLRLIAMQYSRRGLNLLDHDCKFILAESLPEQRHNQVDTFLEQHGGAGIQHVALYTTDIVSTAAVMAKSGVNFVKTPLAYYTDKRKEQEIQQTGQDLQLLKNHGILLDAEVGGEGDNNDSAVLRKPYLMQIFTKPLFREDTFFLELIERCGATGFGGGNVRALWKAVQNYMGQK